MERLTPDAVEQIAYHSYTGEDWPRAFCYQAAAGKQAQKLFANQEGIEHFQRALQAAGHLGEGNFADQQQIYASLGELLATIGQYKPACEQLDRALELGRELGDPDAQARACPWIAYVYEFLSN